MLCRRRKAFYDRTRNDARDHASSRYVKQRNTLFSGMRTRAFNYCTIRLNSYELKVIY